MDHRNFLLFSVFSIFTLNVMAQEKIVQTAGRDRLGTFAPKFAELNDEVLFGEVWSRTDKLGLRDRSLVTITSLISMLLCRLAEGVGSLQFSKRSMV